MARCAIVRRGRLAELPERADGSERIVAEEGQELVASELT
jgi:hypothetical protein